MSDTRLAPADPSHDLWAITCHFNPLRYERRPVNYRLFRSRLDIPLVAVELVYVEPELRPEDADVLIQLHGDDVMWQKERLLNIALAAVPKSCERIVIIDADLVFLEPDWKARVHDALDRAPLCQAFQGAYEAPPEWDGSTGWDRPSTPEERSLASLLARGTGIHDLFAAPGNLREKGCCPGMAWAAHRKLLTTHGLYDAFILGGAYPAIACAALGCFEVAEGYFGMNDAQSDHYRAWARPFHADVRGRFEAAENTLAHLWHGALPNRLYRQRYTDLAPYDFDPRSDLAPADAGCWRWASDKPELHDYVREYFTRRREDG